MNAKAAKAALRDQIRDRLRSVASQATRAQRISVESDNLCDRLDEIDNELQAVIALVNRARNGEIRGDA